MNLNSREGLIARLRRGRGVRAKFVESHVGKGVAYQIRAIRDSLGWSQGRLAEEVGMPQNAVSRLESPQYGKPTLTTLMRLAAAFDVGLVVRFVPFSEMVDWVSGTPRINKGLGSDALEVPPFEKEEELGLLATHAPKVWQVDTGTVRQYNQIDPGELTLHNVGPTSIQRKPVANESCRSQVFQTGTSVGVITHVQ